MKTITGGFLGMGRFCEIAYEDDRSTFPGGGLQESNII